MRWIRIATTIGTDPSVGALADTLKIRVPEAVGLLALVFTQLPEHSRDGCLASVADSTIERWAMWHGKRNAFAQAFRANLCDDKGFVRSWEKHNGSAIREADAARERMKQARVRRTFGEQSGEQSQPVRRTFPTDGTGRSSSSSSTPHFSRFDDDAACAAYAAFRRAHGDPDAFDSALAGIAEPITGNGFGWKVLGKALADMSANNATWNVELARGYCRRIVNPPPVRQTAGPRAWQKPEAQPTNMHVAAPAPKSALCQFCVARHGIGANGRPAELHAPECALYDPTVRPLNAEGHDAA